MSDSFLHRFIMLPKFWWLRHGLFWFFLYIEEVLTFIGIGTLYLVWSQFLFDLFLDMGLVYINLYFFIPKYLNKNKINLYVLLTVFTFLIVITINYLTLINSFDYTEYDLDHFGSIMSSILLTIGIIGPAIAIKVFKNNWYKDVQFARIRAQNLESELASLKKQVNPHFLFNTLNSIYVQSKTAPETVSDSIMMLADLMRYQTYDGMKDKIGLKHEIAFVENYLRMEQMRRENLEINIKREDLTYGLVAIPPLLLLPLIENACKYSQETNPEKKQFINFTISKDSEYIYFKIENNIGQSLFTTKSNDSGVGLENVKRRLALLYPNSHDLILEENSKVYVSKLTLTLKN